MNSLEILDTIDQLKKEAKTLTASARKEIRMLNEEETRRLEDIKTEIKSLNEKKEENKRLEEGKNTNTIKMEERERKFSILEVLRSVANNKPLDEFNQSILEQGATEMRNAGISYQGQIQLPTAEFRTVTVTTEGVDTVATDLFNVLEPLRAKNVLSAAGCKWLTGLQGDVQYPVMSAINATWEGETTTTSDSTPTFTNVKLQPKRLSVVVPISKQFLIQESCGAEQAIRNEIVNAINAKLESTILGNAAGTTTQPEGIFYNGGQSLTQVTDFSDICDMEADIETANFFGEMKYIMAPDAKGNLRGMIKGTNATGMVFENGEVDGTPALTTSHVATGQLAYGDWSNLIIGQWGTIDITVDNVTLAADGQIRLVVNAYFDAKLARTGAIAVRTL